MSYDISLRDPVSSDTLVLDSPHHMRGGTYRVRGNPKATLNVTYNYADHFCFRTLHGVPAVDSIPILETRIAQLQNDVDNDYWKPTEGNVKQALIQLLTLAKLRPDGVWYVD